MDVRFALQVTVLEARNRLGGHVHTHTMSTPDDHSAKVPQNRVQIVLQSAAHAHMACLHASCDGTLEPVQPAGGISSCSANIGWALS